MNWLNRLFRRRKMDEQLEKELRFHIDQQAGDLVARGLDPEEALRQARLSFGGSEQVKEDCRDARGTRWIEDLLQDCRYAARRLRANPGFTAVSVLTLALGLGSSTAIFSAVNSVLFRALPYPNPHSIMMIWERQKDGARNPGGNAFGVYRALVEGNRSFDSIAVMKSWQPTISGADQPERIDGQRVSASYFRVLGILPALGRVFDRSEDQSNGANVVILSDSLWHRRFGHDPSIIGKQIDLDDDSSELTAGGNTYTVIGVMPEDFVNVLAPSVELWAPLQYGMNQGRTWGHHLRMVGRLLPGVSPAQANSDLDRIGNTLIQEHPNDVFNSRFVVNSLQEDVTRQVKPALLAVFGAVILVLLIACVNVTNLLLARGAQRRGEFAMRAALGASRTRLIRQLLTECFQLSIGGGAIGMAVAAFGSQAIVALSPSQLPRFGSIGVDATIFAFGLGATALMGVCFGLIPALNASRTDLRSGIQQGSQRTAGGYQSTRNALVVAEVALALILLVSSGLLLRSLQRLFAVNPGFDSSHLLTMQVQEVGSRFQSDGARNRFYADALDAVRRTPGVQAAAFSSQLPLSSDDDEYGVVFQSDNDPDNHYPVFRYAVSPGYFETMNIPLRQGRFLDERDAGDGPVAVLINESLAKSKFKGQDPIGQHLHFGPDSDRWDTIVGVVGDVSQKSLAAGQPDAVYIPSSRWPGVDTVQSLVVRANGNVDALAADVKNAVWSVDRGQPIVRVETIDEVVAAAFAERRFALLLFEGFGIMALLLAAIGLYGVLSGSVAERTREIGIRSALGASRGGILALVVRQGMGLTCLGAAIGLVGAVAASRALSSLLFGISQYDPVTYGGVILLLAAAAAIACLVPAWRAARVAPSIALRAE